MVRFRNPVPNTERLSLEAALLWATLPAEVRDRAVNHAWCRDCRQRVALARALDTARVLGSNADVVSATAAIESVRLNLSVLNITQMQVVSDEADINQAIAELSNTQNHINEKVIRLCIDKMREPTRGVPFASSNNA